MAIFDPPIHKIASNDTIKPITKYVNMKAYLATTIQKDTMDSHLRAFASHFRL